MESLQDPGQHLNSMPSDQLIEHGQEQFPGRPATSLLHPPLLGPHNIRLLQLRPGSFDQDIECDISVHDFSSLVQYDPVSQAIYSSLQYDAISYTWADETGNDDLCRTLFVSGQPLAITRNCENALKRIRMITNLRFIWIDAVCINQNDISERNHQVQLMSRIYSQANDVLLYIGEAANDSDFCLDLLNDTNQYKPMDYSIDDLNQSSRALAYDRDYTFLDDPRGFNKEHKRKAYVAWRYLLQRPYWSRAWVLQEFALAVNVRVVCGDKHISWRLLSRPERFDEFVTDTSELPGLSFMKLEHLNTRFSRNATPRKLLSLLDMLRFCHAKDPRDKVYAILGLVSKNSRQILTADYNLSVRELYVNTALELAVRPGWGHVLRRAGIKRCAITTLPSWVPDWSCSIEKSTDLDYHQIRHAALQYDASEASMKFSACRIGLAHPKRTYLFDITKTSNHQQDNEQGSLPQGLCLSNRILTGMRNWPGINPRLCARVNTYLCLDFTSSEAVGDQLVATLHDSCWDKREFYLISVHDVVAMVLLTRANQVSTMLQSIHNTFQYQMGGPWCKLLRYTRKRPLNLIPEDVILSVVTHESRPPKKVDSLWRDTVALDSSTQEELKAVEQYRDGDGVLVRPNEYELLLKLNDAVWKLLVRLFLFEELNVKLI